MSTEESRTIARRFREEIWNTGNLGVADQICASAAVFHIHDPLTPDFGSGPKALKQLVTMYRAAFPDAHCTIEDILSEGDKVVIRWTARATHDGYLGKTPPTGKSMKITGIDILRIAGGKIVESWVNWDTLGMLQQLGIFQPSAQAAG
jgi:predicted ester cyclase